MLRTGTRTVAVALTVAAFTAAAATGTAVAAPTTQLPDADLFCGPGYDVRVSGFTALPQAASQWIDDPTLGGHYLVLDVAHYLAPGLLHEPVDDLSTLDLLHSHSYGSRSGLSEPALECQVVSRFADSGVTVIAPLTLVRVPSAG
jgi:hypothetical protein